LLSNRAFVGISSLAGFVVSFLQPKTKNTISMNGNKCLMEILQLD